MLWPGQVLADTSQCMCFSTAMLLHWITGHCCWWQLRGQRNDDFSELKGWKFPRFMKDLFAWGKLRLHGNLVTLVLCLHTKNCSLALRISDRYLILAQQIWNYYTFNFPLFPFRSPTYIIWTTTPASVINHGFFILILLDCHKSWSASSERQLLPTELSGQLYFR